MKYNILALSMITLGLWGCTHQPINSQIPVNKKIYYSYEQLVSKQSYAFDGNMKFSVTPIAKTPNSTVVETVSKEYQFREKILQDIFAAKKLNKEQQELMQDGLESFKSGKSKSSDKDLATFIQAFINRYYYTFDGVVDFKRGQISVNPKIGYSAKNLQGWIMLPMALDLQDYKAYIDISALSPIVTDPKYDGRYVVFDFADIIKKSDYDIKPVLNLMRESSLITPAMANTSDYQYVALTDEDKQRGGVERIRYVGEYNQLLADYYLYFYLNENYIKTLVPKKNSQLIQDMMLGGLVNAQSSESAEQAAQAAAEAAAAADAVAAAAMPILTKSEQAWEAADRLENAIDELYISKEGYPQPVSQISKDVEEIEQAAAVEEAAQATDVVDEAQKIEEMEKEYAIYAAKHEQQKQALEKFASYKSEQLVDAKRLRQIVDEQPEAYQELITFVSNNFPENMFKKSNYTMDMVLDNQGRIVRFDMLAMIGGMESLGLETINTQMQANIHSYGSARVDQQQLKQAVSFKEAANQNSMLKLGEKFEEFKQSLIGGESTSNEVQEAKSFLSNDERYQILAEQLMAQKMSFIDAYTTVYKYAYILEGLDIEDEFVMQDLNNTARWAAIYYASEHDMPYTKQQYKEYEDSPDDWMYYDDYVADKVWEAFVEAGVQENTGLAEEYNKLKKQGKSTAEIFSQLYTMKELEYQERESIDPKLAAYIKMLGQVAAKDLQNQKIDKSLLKQFSVSELDRFDPDIYHEVYQLFLK